MRKQFFETKKEAKECDWFTVIAKVDGGYLCFESTYDYFVWDAQK